MRHARNLNRYRYIAAEDARTAREKKEQRKAEAAKAKNAEANAPKLNGWQRIMQKLDRDRVQTTTNNDQQP